MEFTVEKFNETKHAAEEFYFGVVHVYCPYFGEKISFNVKGWDHLIFKRWNKPRAIEDQYSRIRHIKLAPEILKISKTVQGIWVTNKFERVKRGDKRWEKILRLTTYYEFIAVMESHGSKVRFKIIVKQIEGSEKHFLSIIPHWGTDESGNRILHTGNPEED